MSETLLPSNATVTERAMELASARIEQVPLPARYAWSPQNAPSQILPWLAWAFSVDTWDTKWTEEQKRSAIAASYVVHRQKGTIGAIRRALDALGIGVTIVEWFQDTPQGEPYTFRLSISPSSDTSQAAFLKAIAVANSTKNLRSHMTEANIAITSDSTHHYAAVTGIGTEMSVVPVSIFGLLTLDGKQITTLSNTPLTTY